MLELDASRLVIERDPAVREDDDRWWFDRGRGRCDSFAEAVADHPDLAAWMLEQCGVSYDDFQMALWAEEMDRSEEHTSELQSLMRISYAVFCLKKKNKHMSK